jgi:endonuclease/exonuclease/phosphatase family metal-dependent hydrolase
MLGRFLSFALLLALVSPGAASAREGTRSGLVRVATSNIRFDADDAPGRRWVDRRDALATLLLDAQPDILGTQEGWAAQLDELAERLPGLERTDTDRRWAAGRMYPTILFRSNRFELLRSGDRWLSETPEVPDSRFALSPYPRTLAWAVLRERSSGAALFVANAHLTHLLPWVRRAQARVLAEQIRGLNRDGHPVILLGDFNERPTGGTRDTLEKALPALDDPWGRRDDPELTTFHAYGGWLAGGRIDWILLDRCLAIEEVRILRRERGASEGAHPLDHHPVLATFAPGGRGSCL